MNIHHEFLDLLEAVPRLMNKNARKYVGQQTENTWRAKGEKTIGAQSRKNMAGPCFSCDCYPYYSFGFDPTMFSAFWPTLSVGGELGTEYYLFFSFPV